MSVKNYSNKAAYNAAGVPADESRVALIEDTNEVMIDAVNAVVPTPQDGDAVFIDSDDNVFFVRRDTLNASLISSDWTLVGYAFGFNGKQYYTYHKNHADLQYLAVWQYSITAISSTSITISLRMKGDYANAVSVPVTLTSAAINSTTVAEINAALEAAGNTGNIGYANHGYWAYLADDNDNKVTDDADATKIIIQCDFTAAWQQVYVGGTGCTIALSVWGDMPASSALLRRNGVSSYYGGMNYKRFYAYYSANGGTPSSNVAVRAADPVNENSFNTSEYCADLRTAYGTYENYLKQNMVLQYQKYGVFGLMDAEEMTTRYGNATAPKKDGTTVYKFPALHHGASVGYGNGKFAVGKWHLSDVDEGLMYMSDEVLEKIADAQTRMGTTVLANNVNRWFARRYNGNGAWYFDGNDGNLILNGVYGTSRCQAVTLSDLD